MYIMLLLLKKHAHWRGPNIKKITKNHHFSAPPIHTFFEQHQDNVPRKITFFMKIYHYENNNTIQSEKLEKIQFYCFHPCHVGVLCSKILIAFCNI